MNSREVLSQCATLSCKGTAWDGTRNCQVQVRDLHKTHVMDQNKNEKLQSFDITVESSVNKKVLNKPENYFHYRVFKEVAFRFNNRFALLAYLSQLHDMVALL